MLAWLAKLDPNTVAAVVSALALYVYHRLSPATQAKVADAASSALATAMQTADRVMASLLAVAPAGTTRADLEAQLWTAARTQLSHIGLDPDKLPQAATDAAKALIDKYLAEYAARTAPVPTVVK